MAHIVRPLVLCALQIALCQGAMGYETDQYTSASHAIANSDGVLDGIVNDCINDTANDWVPGTDPKQYYIRIANCFDARQFEAWVIGNSKVASFFPSADNIYVNASWLNAPVVFLKGLATTISINNTHIGADKLSHFFGVGSVYVRKFIENGADAEGEKRALETGRSTEHWYWGAATTGVFSNADLVANYEGFRFLRSLIPGYAGAGVREVIRWQNGFPVVVGQFHFSDYVNEFWSEALNPSSYRPLLFDDVKEAIATLCVKGIFSQYRGRLVSSRRAELDLRYAKLGMLGNRNDASAAAICQEVSGWSGSTRSDVIQKHQRLVAAYEARKRHPSRGLKINVDSLRAEVPQRCLGEISSARAEHSAIVRWWNANASRMRGAVRQILQVGSSSNTTLFLGDAFRLQKKSNGNTRACIRADIPTEGEAAKRRLQLSVQLCAERESTSEREYEHLKYWVRSNETPSSWLASVDPLFGTLLSGKLNYSSYRDGYFEFNDAVGYIYRTISPLCRWY